MAKFGEIISGNEPVLICFYDNIITVDDDMLKQINMVFKEKVRIIKINTFKNNILVNALGINDELTYTIYKNGEIKWSKEGSITTIELLTELQQFL